MAKSANDFRIMEQKDMISQLNMVISSQNELITSLRGTVEECNATICSLREQVEYLTRKLFGASSEKSKTIAEQEAHLPEGEPAAKAVIKEHTRSAKRTGKETFKGVPSRDEVIPLSDGQRHCADCGSEMEVIGKEFVRQEFRFTPAKGEAVNIYRETAKCPKCSAASAMARNIQFVKANVPEALIPHSYAPASAAAWVMYQKYANSMSLYRQEQDWKQMGTPLYNRAAPANWIIYCAGNCFSPLYDYFHRELLKRQFLMADETRIQVLKEPEREAETDSYHRQLLWRNVAVMIASAKYSRVKRSQFLLPLYRNCEIFDIRYFIKRLLLVFSWDKKRKALKNPMFSMLSSVPETT